MASTTGFKPSSNPVRNNSFADLDDEIFDNLIKGITLRPKVGNFEADPKIKVKVFKERKTYRVKAKIVRENKENIQFISAAGAVDLTLPKKPAAAKEFALA